MGSTRATVRPRKGRRLLRGGVGLALLVVAAITIPLALAGGGGSSTGVSRVEQTFVRAWSYGCQLDACTGGPRPFPPIEVATPGTTPEVDVVVTVTMEHKTTAGDYGLVRMRYVPTSGPPVAMAPGDFRLDTSGDRTTTTLTWITRDLTAGGNQYSFELFALPRSGNGDGSFSFSGRRFALVIEMWSAG